MADELTTGRGANDENVAGERPSSFLVDRVGDDEVVDRSVWLRPECFKMDANGTVRVSANAFADRSRKPSFYRRNLTENPPYSRPPRMNEDDAVVSIVASAIRHLSPVLHLSGSGSNVAATAYVIDIEPDTSNGQHVSHAVVFATPDYKQSRPFEKLKERLVSLVKEWAIPPADSFIREHLSTK